jgi:protein-S-isoprenylcysteine O-methyltransferase Ste14
MYFATVLMFLAIPLILGDIFSFILFLVYPFMIAKRIKDEEKLLENELDGYREYQKMVKFKMIPFIW